MSFYLKTCFYTALFISCSYSISLAQEFTGMPNAAMKGVMTDALYVDAVKARMLNDTKQEEELLKQVIKEKPQESAPYYDLAQLSRKQKKLDQAEQNIKKAIELDKDNAWYQVAYAEILEGQNKVKEAAAVYTALAQKQKYNKDHLFNAARLSEKAGDFKGAIALLDQLIQRIGNEEVILMQKQQLHLRMNDLDGAVKVAQQLISQNPREGRYYANLADLYDSNNQGEKAIEIYQKALKDFPNDPSIQYGLAEYYRKKKDMAKYDEYIRKAILNREFDDETQTTILFSYLQELNADSVRKKESLGITEQLAAQHPDNPQILTLFGEVLLENDSTARAVEQFKKALAIDPARFNVWQRLMFTYTDRKDADSLIKYSEKAMRYFPNQAMVHYLNGIGHFNEKSYPAAIKSINRAIDLQPDDNAVLLSDMYSSLGDIYNTIKDHKQSDSSYEKSLRLNPKNPTVLNNYAYYLSERGVRLADAEKMSKESLELRPGEATFLDTYGWILYKQGKYEGAKKYIEDALKANPEADGTLWEHLGDIYFKLGDANKAVENWKKAKEKGTENTQIDKKIQDRKIYE
jgi:tetratricopeptide (TPR) repeat protein